jgi:hypothetical protein
MGWQDPLRVNSVTENVYHDQLRTNLLTLAGMIQHELTTREPGYAWRTDPNIGGNGDLYLNIFINNNPFAHISFHMTPSVTPDGSTHIQYHGGPTRRILIERGLFIGDYHSEPHNNGFEEIIINGLNQFALAYPQIVRTDATPTTTPINTYTYRNKYLKYKNKYLQLKYELGI